MNRGSRTVLIIILVIAALLGIGAIALLWYNSTINDQDGDDNNNNVSANKCNQIFVLDASENAIDNDATLDPAQPIFIGAEFQVDKDVLPDQQTGADVELQDFGFAFTVNSANQPEVVTTVDVEESGDYYIFKPQYSYSDFGGDSTLSIVADFDAEENVALDNSLGANSSCAAVYEVKIEGNQGSGSCVAVGDTGTISEDQCCTGLEQVDNCTEPDSNNQCTLEVPECFTCVNALGDNECGTGENECNSPQDCTGEPGEPTEEPDACISAGNTGDGGAGEVCCNNLFEVNCETPDSNNSCSEADASCFRCISGEPGDNVCGSGENICNSFEDCGDGILEPTDPGEPSAGGGDDDGDFDPTEPTSDNSNFTVTVTTATQCVERITPNNDITILITIRNAGSTTHDVAEVTNALPLGFTYISGSTVINGAADTGDQYLTLNNIGDSEELVWTVSNGWSVSANGTLTIQFRAIADQNALTGSNLNQVVVTPENIPVNSDALRASLSITVAQNCSTPQTAIFGDSSTKIIAGIVALIIAMVFYITSAGEMVSMKLAGNKVIRDQAEKVRMVHLKKSNPREYFEEKFRKKDKK
ncbi:MAG: hypothetical protein QY318_01755 [Candidatus Dojkabacteria bacterium]|nr:MAG: hypothetical protein QY318_01755 [Candidatus Dojkabacteria bacterium]